MLKIAITGPESSGKTSITQALANHYNAPWVPEYAREYLEKREGKYVYADLVTILRGQIQLERNVLTQRSPICFIDTSPLEIVIWSREKYGKVASSILQAWETYTCDLFLLMKPDIPWIEDPLRENPHDRPRLFDMYHAELKHANHNYRIIEGASNHRLKTAIQWVNHLQSSH